MNKEPVYYLQTDPRWKNIDYSAPKGESKKRTIGSSGCGPTCAAMLIETMTGKKFTPADACAWSLQHGYKAANQGTYYSYFPPQFKAFGIACRQLNSKNIYGNSASPVHKEAFDLLKQGYYLIAVMGKGLWTTSGHYIVVWWEDGRVRINDPNSQRPDRTHGNLTTFKAQVKYYWAIDAREFNEEDDDMTQEKFNEMFEKAMVEHEAKRAARPVSTWAKALWDKLRSKGIVDGKRPQSYATREEVVTIVQRMKEG